MESLLLPLISLGNWLEAQMFAPHGVCLTWSKPLLWTYIVSDSVIALSYFSIPIALFYFARKRKDLGFRNLFVLFGLFILACGTTHLMDVWKLWYPNYWTDAVIREFTAVVSLVTAVLLWRLLPKALTIPSPAQLRAQNEQLEREIRAREAVELELREAKLLLEERAELLEHSNRDLQDFAYVASHDLKEPLRMITSYLQLLKRRYAEKLDETAHEFVDIAVDGAQRMSQLISDLLAYSRIAQGKAWQQVEVQVSLDRALANLRVALHERQAKVESGPLPRLQADPTQLTQLFQNLLANALKFSREGVSPELVIVAQDIGSHWQFSVKDNGIGMEKENLERIFQIFQRLHKREHYEGTGIGLAVCQRIVERHKGEIWVESVPGEGSTFFFTISKALEPQPLPKPQLQIAPTA